MLLSGQILMAMDTLINLREVHLIHTQMMQASGMTAMVMAMATIQ